MENPRANSYLEFTAKEAVRMKRVARGHISVGVIIILIAIVATALEAIYTTSSTLNSTGFKIWLAGYYIFVGVVCHKVVSADRQCWAELTMISNIVNCVAVTPVHCFVMVMSSAYYNLAKFTPTDDANAVKNSLASFNLLIMAANGIEFILSIIAAVTCRKVARTCSCCCQEPASASYYNSSDSPQVPYNQLGEDHRTVYQTNALRLHTPTQQVIPTSQEDPTLNSNNFTPTS